MEALDFDGGVDFVTTKGDIASEQWDEARSLIERVYRDEKKDFKHVAEEIHRNFRFRPTKRQFGRKVRDEWKITKYNKAQRRVAGVNSLVPAALNHGVVVELVDSSDHEQSVTQTHKPEAPAEDVLFVPQQSYEINTSVCHLVTTSSSYSFGDASVEKPPKSSDLADNGSGSTQQNCGLPAEVGSLELTQIFETLTLYGCDFHDEDTPLMSLPIDEDDDDSVDEVVNCVTPAEVMMDYVHLVRAEQKKPIQKRCIDVVVYDKSSNRILVKGDENSGTNQCERVWESSVDYDVCSLDYELYPFAIKCVGRTRRSASSIQPEPTIYDLKTRLDKLVSTMPETHPAVLSAMKALADRYYNDDLHGLERPIRCQIVGSMEQLYGKGDSRTLGARTDLIDCIFRAGEPKAAATEIEVLRRQILSYHSLDHELVLNCLLTAAVIAIDMRQLQQAEESLQQCFYLCLNYDGIVHKRTLYVIQNLSHILNQRKSLIQAEQLRRVAAQLALRVDILEARKWSNMSNLACLLALQGRHMESVSLIEFVISSSKAYEFRNQRAVEIMSFQAHILRESGEQIRAIEAREKVLYYRQKLSGDHHPNTILDRSNLAGSLYNSGNFEDALDHYLICFSRLERIYGLEHAITLENCHDVGDCYEKLGQHEKALELFEDTINRLKLIDGDYSEEIEDLQDRIDWLHDYLAQEDSESGSVEGSVSDWTESEQISELEDDEEMEFCTEADKNHLEQPAFYGDFSNFDDLKMDDQLEDLYSAD